MAKINQSKGRAGRKSRYHTHVEPYMERIKYWRRMGLLEKEIYVKLGVSQKSFYDYKRDHLQLSQALKESKEQLDNVVMNALVKRALGFRYTEDVLIKDQVVQVTKYVVPNTTAQIFYLKNRCPEFWRDVQEFLHRGKVDTGTAVNITQIFEAAIKEKTEDARAKIVANLNAFYNGNGGRFRVAKKEDLRPVNEDN